MADYPAGPRHTIGSCALNFARLGPVAIGAAWVLGTAADNAYHLLSWRYHHAHFVPDETPLNENQNDRARAMLKDLVAHLDSEKLRALSSGGELAKINVPTFSPDAAIDRHQLGQLADELHQPSPTNEIFKGQSEPPELRPALRRLMSWMSAHHVPRVPRAMLREAVDQELAARAAQAPK